MPTSPSRTTRPTHLDALAAPHILAVFAAHLAVSCRFCHPPCHFLPFLPPVTPHVKLPDRPNRLEFNIREETTPEYKMKSGKNGNVDWDGQHCRLSSPAWPDFVAQPSGVVSTAGCYLPVGDSCPRPAISRKTSVYWRHRRRSSRRHAYRRRCARRPGCHPRLHPPSQRPL